MKITKYLTWDTAMGDVNFHDTLQQAKEHTYESVGANDESLYVNEAYIIAEVIKEVKFTKIADAKDFCPNTSYGECSDECDDEKVKTCDKEPWPHSSDHEEWWEYEIEDFKGEE